MQQYLRQSFLKNKPLRPDGLRAGERHRQHQARRRRTTTAPRTSCSASCEKNGRSPTTPRPSRTARYFLGLQVQCTQCHNHPFNDWKQDQFWEHERLLPADQALRTIRAAAATSIRPGSRTRISTAKSNTPKEAEIYLRAAQRHRRKVAYPDVCRRHDRSTTAAIADEVDRRAELAKLIVKSEYLARRSSTACGPISWATASPSRSTTSARTIRLRIRNCWSSLGSEFAAHGHDLKQLIRWITLSEAYALSSKLGAEEQARTIRRWARSRCSATSTCGRCGPRSCTNRCSWPPRRDKTKRQLRGAGEDQGRMARAVHHRLRHRRRGRYDDVQRHDSADADDDERRHDQKATEHREGQLSGNSRRRRENEQRAPKINYLYLSALARKPTGREYAAGQRTDGCSAAATRGGPARRLVGGAQQQRVHFESLERVSP